MMSAVPTTSSSAAAVKTSRLLVRAMNLKRGPHERGGSPPTTTAMTADALRRERAMRAAPAPAPRPAAAAARAPGSPRGPGTAARRTPSRPWRAVNCPRSASDASTIAVDDSASAEADDQRGLPGEPERHARRRRARAPVSADLRAAEAEHRAAQRPQPRRLELEADQEQQQHDAELGELQRRSAAPHEPSPHGPMSMPAAR